MPTPHPSPPRTPADAVLPADAHRGPADDDLDAPHPAGAEVPPAGPPEADSGPALSVTGAARGLGVAAATLRSWERRYGLAPSLHTKGGHRRYGPADLARLQVMHRLVRDGVPPAEAARVAIRARIELDQGDGPYAAVLSASPGTLPATGAGTAEAEPGQPPIPDEAVAGPPGGGRVLPMPHASRAARGLARAAIALDATSCRRTVAASLADRGTRATWEELIRPVLASIGDHWAQTGRGVEVEHTFSMAVTSALAAHAAALSRPRNSRPVLLASVPDELHDLPLVALAAALADEGVRSHLIGARTPEEALTSAVLRLGPPVVFLWSQMGRARAPRLPTIRPAPALVVGGPGWAEPPEAAIVVHDLVDAVGAVRTVMGL